MEAIIVATVTLDMLFPPRVCLVQDKLGAKGAWGRTGGRTEIGMIDFTHEIDGSGAPVLNMPGIARQYGILLASCCHHG